MAARFLRDLLRPHDALRLWDLLRALHEQGTKLTQDHGEEDSDSKKIYSFFK